LSNRWRTKNALDPEQAVKLAALVDDYLDAQQIVFGSRGYGGGTGINITDN